MPALTVGRMAKLYSMNRASLYQAIDEGRISAGLDAKGQKVIDLAEMIRVYGEPKACPTAAPQLPNSAQQAQPVGEVLGAEIVALRAAVERLTAEVEALRAELKEVRLLEHKPADMRQGRTAAIEHSPPVQPERLGRPQSFADLLSALD